MNENGKTIKQLADEIGVSKQAVYKRYKGKLNTVCAYGKWCSIFR